MNFSTVRGYNAYAQFTAKIREAVKNRAPESEEPEAGSDYSRFIYSEPVDTVTISEPAREASAALIRMHENKAHDELRKFKAPDSVLQGNLSKNISGSVMNKVLAGSGITVGDDEEYSLKIDIQSTITISSKNEEKARAIQNLFNRAPFGINWGLLLTGFPPS